MSDGSERLRKAERFLMKFKHSGFLTSKEREREREISIFFNINRTKKIEQQLNMH